MGSQARLHYPTKAQIARAIQAGRECGIDVAGYEIAPGGAIRIIEARASSQGATPANDFDRWFNGR